MAKRSFSFESGIWYHCYSFSVNGSTAFLTTRDYERFLQSLYLCNNTAQVRRGALYLPTHEKLLLLPRSAQLVSIAAFCITPTRFHILLRQVHANGISKFLQKIGTSYAMYKNSQNSRSGNIFIKPFRARVVGKDDQAMRVAQYIHLDAADLYESEWRKGRVSSSARLRKNLADYRYASLRDYERYVRAENSIVDEKVLKHFSDFPSLKEVMPEAAEYLANLTLK